RRPRRAPVRGQGALRYSGLFSARREGTRGRPGRSGPGQLRRWFGAALAGRSSALLLLARGACGGAVLFLARQVGLEASGLAAQLAQVVELRAAGPAAAHALGLAGQRRVEREDALDALAERDLADGHVAAGAAAVLARDDDALEGLDAGPVALGDLVVDTDRVTGVELGDVVPQEGLLDRAQDGAFVVLHRKFSIPGGDRKSTRLNSSHVK